MTALWLCDPISLYSHNITWPLNLLSTLVWNLCVDSWKCSSFGASIVCLNPHQVSRVYYLNPPPLQEEFIKSLFSINLLSTAEYSYFSLYSATVILSLVGYSFTTFITGPELPTTHIHQVALLRGCLQITMSHQSAAYRPTTANPWQPNSWKPQQRRTYNPYSDPLTMHKGSCRGLPAVANTGKTDIIIGFNWL